MKLFFSSEISFGTFLGYVGALSVFAAFALSVHSDKMQKRLRYLFPIMVVQAFVTAMIGFSSTTTMFIVIITMYTIIDNISTPLRLTVQLDIKQTTIGFWRAREVYINLGRVITLGIATALLYLKLYAPLFILFGAITIVYPLAVLYSGKGTMGLKEHGSIE